MEQQQLPAMGTLGPGAYLPVPDDPCYELLRRDGHDGMWFFTCWRSADHEGRHAHITEDGRVLAVWGEDVHAHTRNRIRVCGDRLVGPRGVTCTEPAGHERMHHNEATRNYWTNTPGLQVIS